MRQDKLLELRELQLRRNRLPALVSAISPPKTRALPDSARVGRNLRTMAAYSQIQPLQKPATSCYDEGMVGHAEIFRNSHPQFVDRGLPGHVDPVPQISALIERGKLRVAQFHEKFNDQLSKNNFIAGEKFSVADITTITVCDFGLALGMAIPDHCPM